MSRLIAKLSNLSLLICLTSLLAMPTQAQNDDPDAAPVLQRIIERGALICGVNANLPGFSSASADGEFTGFDIDLCRAVAVAVLNDPNAVEYLPLNADERSIVFAQDRIDMMSRNTTFTLSRDTDWGVIFGPTTFYDGQGIMTRTALGVRRLEELDGEAICVESGTTTELNLTDAIRSRDLAIEIQVYPTSSRSQAAYISGRCAAWTTDKSGLASFRQQTEDPSEHVILAETLSKEPLGPLSPQIDPQFAEIIRWTVFGLIQAEEFGITSDNIDDFLQDTDADTDTNTKESDDDYIRRVGPNVARFLGQANQEAGSYLGIDNDFMLNVIRALGNYGQLYERHLTPLGLDRERTLNDLWTNGGLMYAPPFR